MTQPLCQRRATTRSGGGLYSTGGALTIAGATLANNQVIGGRGGDIGGVRAGNGGDATGGGMYATGGSLDISDSMIASNQTIGGPGGNGTSAAGHGNGGVGGAGQGGGLYVNGNSLTIATSTIASNQGTGGSAGYYGTLGVGQGAGIYNFPWHADGQQQHPVRQLRPAKRRQRRRHTTLAR